jgi:hypothetical protein
MAALMASKTSTAAFARRQVAAKPVARAAVARRSLVVKAHCEKPLVGSVAPDFKAQAVFDQVIISTLRGS